MTTGGKEKDADGRIFYDRPGFENVHRHVVRSSMEAKVCDWLMQHRVAHRHASKIFTLSLGPAGAASIYVPDIVLHDRTVGGKTVIIEVYQVSVPKKGGTRLLAAFREQNKGDYYLIVIARRQYRKYILKGSYDALIPIEQLDDLGKKIPPPPL